MSERAEKVHQPLLLWPSLAPYWVLTTTSTGAHPPYKRMGLERWLSAYGALAEVLQDHGSIPSTHTSVSQPPVYPESGDPILLVSEGSVCM